MSSKLRSLLIVPVLITLLAFSAGHTAGTSILFLPAHVSADDGKVTLFADYDAAEADGQVPVYLVNRSHQDLTLNAQDGDIYLKLQYQNAAGDWVRAQPHGYSFCGNSYMQVTVAAGHYLQVRGFQPASGETRTVRYELYSQDIEVTSNTGSGLVFENDVQRAASDVMSLHEGSFEYVSSVALSIAPVRNNMDHMSDLRYMAIAELGSDRFDANDSRAVLEAVRQSNPEQADNVARALQRLSRR